LLIAQSPPGTYDNILSDAEFVQQLNEAGYLEELNAADYVALVFAFIFLPIAASFVFSFNSERFPTIPLGHFTAHWYATALSHPDVWEAARASLIVSFTTAVIATGLGFSAAYTDYRYRFFGKTAFLALVLLPLTIPMVIMALAMLGWFSRFQASVPVWSIVLAHSVLTTPFAMAIIRLRLNQMDESLEAAAWNLGASQWRAMREVIIPFTQPAIVSALCLTAAVSFDEFAVAWFVSGLNKTIPVIILEILTGNVDPQINAIGSFVFLTSIRLVIVAQMLIMTRDGKA
jgi:spermidine/putrescine transport system permease protein